MAEEQDDAQKTEDPTPKRLEQARKKGQVALSREVNNWVMLFMGTILIAVIFGGMMTELSTFLRSYIEQADQMTATEGGSMIALGEGIKRTMRILAMPLGLLFIAAFLAPFVQIGPLFAPESIKPELSKLSLIKGFKRLFSTRSLMEFAKGILKIAFIGLIGVIIIKPYFGQFEHIIGLPVPMIMEELQTLVIRVLIAMLIALFVIAMVDLVYQRSQHHKKMRMTKQEVKDEYKQAEGDPHVKGRLRQLRAEKSRQRMMQAVPQADVIITNPTHYSIALKYDADAMEAPKCLAKGVDDVAMRIREVAKEHDIPLFENKPLARTLFDTVDVDEFIPPEHYKAVAEVISYIFKLKNRLGR